MVEKIKTVLVRRLLCQTIEKSSILAKSIEKTLFYKFWKQISIYCGHKHVETALSCSHEIATFVKYHMPLIIVSYVNPLLNNFLFKKLQIS